MNTRRWLWIVAALAAAVVLFAVRAKRVREKENAPLLKPAPAAVNVAPITRGPVVRTRHVLGKIVGGDEAALAPRIMAAIIAIDVREGDRVRKGDLLVRLDAREPEEARGQAEAGLAAARTAWETQRDITARDSVLFVATAVSQEQWDRARSARDAAMSRWRSAQKARDLARTRLSYTRLVAPFDGVVAARMADPGDLAIPGRPLIKLVRQSHVRVRADLPARDFSLLKIGQPARLTVDGVDVLAAVSRVFPAMGNDHLAAVEIDLSDPPVGFVSGATAGVDLTLQTTESLRVPIDALLEGANGTFVFVVSKGAVRPVQVQILNRSLDQTTVSGDLNEGEQVVVARPARLMTLAEGTPVVVGQEGAP